LLNQVPQSLQTDLIWNFTIVVLPFLSQFLFSVKYQQFAAAWMWREFLTRHTVYFWTISCAKIASFFNVPNLPIL